MSLPEIPVRAVRFQDVPQFHETKYKVDLPWNHLEGCLERHALDGQATFACGLCGNPTPMTGTDRCNRCGELERRAKADPELARRILDQLLTSH